MGDPCYLASPSFSGPLGVVIDLLKGIGLTGFRTAINILILHHGFDTRACAPCLRRPTYARRSGGFAQARTMKIRISRGCHVFRYLLILTLTLLFST